MKKIISALAVVLMATTFSACNYLDVDPELGLSDDEVFSSYTNFSSYFYLAYETLGGDNKYSVNVSFPLYIHFNILDKMTFDCTTDAADNGIVGPAARNFKNCNLTQEIIEHYTTLTASGGKPLLTGMMRMIRQANLTIERIDECQNITQQQYDDLLGQCYAMRGYCHFILAEWFGGMPYIDHTLGADDEWDLPRESAHTTYVKAAEDLYKGYEYLNKAGCMRRDARPGQPGHLTATQMQRFSGCGALGIRARALLYAASPLNNELGEEDWKVAAEACALAIKAAEEEQYELLPMSKYKDNFVDKQFTNENIWQMSWAQKDNHKNYRGLLAYPQAKEGSAAGTCPTQNFVDKFETIDGYPLNTAEDRAKAEAAGSYMEQDPYCLAPGTTRGRDPRLAVAVAYDGFKNSYIKDQLNIYYDPKTKTYPTTTINGQKEAFAIEWGTMDNQNKGYTNTGYYLNKYWTGKRGDKSSKQYKIDPLVSLSELYLDYAEAVNEAYGPQGKAGGYNLSAVEATNLIRSRALMPPVRSEYTGSKDAFRERLRNERNVELCFVGNHYYFDIRRWKTAPQLCNNALNPLYGMWIEKCDVTPEHPAGRKYERRKLADNRQGIWKDCMYYLPIPDSEANKLKNFVNNDPWR